MTQTARGPRWLRRSRPVGFSHIDARCLSHTIDGSCPLSSDLGARYGVPRDPARRAGPPNA